MTSNKNLREIDIKNCTYHYFDDIINFNDIDPKSIKLYKKSSKDILIY